MGQHGTVNIIKFLQQKRNVLNDFSVGLVFLNKEGGIRMKAGYDFEDKLLLRADRFRY